jgi:hypothetical protein
VSSDLVAQSEKRAYGDLFRLDLNWGAPDHRPVTLETEDGETLVATNVSSFKGLRVWECPSLPGSALEAKLEQLIAKTTTNRLVIFHNRDKQVWRWPSRSSKGSGVTSRPARHEHRTGTSDSKFAAKLEVIRLPEDIVLDVNTVLTRVREAFDVEAKNESKRASSLMARMYGAVENAYSPGFDSKKRDHEISVSLARILFLLFGDDTEMWTPDAFRDFVHYETAKDGSDMAERLNELFVHLDTPTDVLFADLDKSPDPTTHVMAGLRYVNGGIFQERIALPALSKDFRDAVLDACAVDWSTISPAIFGSMFQSVRDARTRRELGEHYTSEENILKTLNPLFLDEFRGDLHAALERDTPRKRANALNALWARIGNIRYMDPACGCGNFIIVAYRELRDIEMQIMLALQDISGDTQLSIDPTLDLKVRLDHFYGIEIDEWPARIAETAMFLVDRQCDLRLKERFGEAPERLPLQRQANITVGNALTLDWRSVVAPTVDLIIAGNPPFLGKEQRNAAQTGDMQQSWGLAYSGEADFVTAWFAKTAVFLDEVAARWAFVATNSICQGGVVPSVFGFLFDRGWRIRFAHRTFEWTSEAASGAAVHCVVVGFQRSLPKRPRLFRYVTPRSAPTELTVSNINAYLVDGPNLLVRDRRVALAPALSSDIRFGSMPADDGGLLVSEAEYQVLSVTDPVAIRHLRPFIGARELLNNTARWCIWMPERAHPDITASPFLRDRISHVRTFRSTRARDPGVRAAAAVPHRFNRVQQPDEPYLCIPCHVPDSYIHYPTARFNPNVISGNANFVISDPDGFYFAVISSLMFMTWQKTVGGRIKNDPRFACTVTWNTLPLPSLDKDMRIDICERGSAILQVRSRDSSRPLAVQYDPGSMSNELLDAHEALDELVDVAFGSRALCQSEPERQKVLFQRYEELTTN